MYFIFGYNYFSLESYSLKELGVKLDEPKVPGMIAVVEIYIHLFYIPVFSLGKRRLYSFAGEYHPIPEIIKSQIDNSRLKGKSKWYAFTGIYIVLLTWALVSYSNFRDNKLEQRNFDEYQKAQKQFLSTPQIGDIYSFDSENVDFKGEIHAITEDSICFTIEFPEVTEPANEASQQTISGIETEPEEDRMTEEEFKRDIVKLMESREKADDSLKLLYPKESVLRTLKYMESIGKSRHYEFITVSKKALQSAYCESAFRADYKCSGQIISKLSSLTWRPVSVTDVQRNSQ